MQNFGEYFKEPKPVKNKHSICQTCGEVFPNTETYAQHCRNSHGNSSAKLTKSAKSSNNKSAAAASLKICHECSLYFASDHGLANHVNAVHKVVKITDHESVRNDHLGAVKSDEKSTGQRSSVPPPLQRHGRAVVANAIHVEMPVVVSGAMKRKMTPVQRIAPQRENAFTVTTISVK